MTVCFRCRFLLLVAVICCSTTARAQQTTVFFGTSGGDSKGIYQSRLSLDTGELTPAVLAAEIPGPSFLAVSPDTMRLYAGCRPADTKGAVAAFEIEPDRQTLKLLNMEQCAASPTHVSLSRDLKTVLVAHYGGGSVASFPLDTAGLMQPSASLVQHVGSSVNKQRQERPHPHWIGADLSDNFVLVPDLGTDEVVVYRFDPSTHQIARHGAGKVAPGAGPRHLAFHPNGKQLYVANEMALTVTGFELSPSAGTLTEFQTIDAVPPELVEPILNACSEIQVHPSGAYLYVATRGHDTISVFQIDKQNGRLTFVEREPVRGSWPRHFGIDPSGQYLLVACADSSAVTVFRIDQETGGLVFTRHQVRVPRPQCVVFLAN